MWEIYIGKLAYFFFLKSNLSKELGPVGFSFRNIIRFRDFGFFACGFRFIGAIFPPDFLGSDCTIGPATSATFTTEEELPTACGPESLEAIKFFLSDSSSACKSAMIFLFFNVIIVSFRDCWWASFAGLNPLFQCQNLKILMLNVWSLKDAVKNSRWL